MMHRILLVVALLAPMAADAAFRCKDEKGVTHIGDSPPPECASVPVYEVTKSGAVIRKLDPTPTPEQLKVRLQEQAKATEAARAATEQQRKDQALLSTYGAEQDFDRARDLAMQPLQKNIDANNTRLKAVEKRQKELDDELEFYKAGKSKGKNDGKAREAPPQLKNDIEILKKEKGLLLESNARIEQEMKDLRTRFEVDKARWLALKQVKK